jgi:2-polyprenyl-3-methyl-5-hydroxy-6-metoxy-1,4-benzoquinol methylase
MAAPAWELEDVACDYCGSRDSTPLLVSRDRVRGVPGDFTVVACRQCGLARTNPRPAPQSMALAYPADYDPHQSERAKSEVPRGLLRWALVNRRGYPLGRPSSALVRLILHPAGWWALRSRRTLKYLPMTGAGRLLDFGCGAGDMVATLAAAGWKAEGIDASPNAVRTARARGLTVHEGTLPGLALPEASYDAVMLWHSLEHVPHPKATLEAVRRLLAPGGRVLVAVPRLDSLDARWFGSCWWGLEVPRHLTHFTAATLRQHIEAAGLKVERVHAFRRPQVIRLSLSLAAEETGRGLYRRLSRSRFLVGMASLVSLAAGKTSQMVVVACR